MNPLKYRTEQKRIAAALVDRMIFLPLLLVEERLYANAHEQVLFFSWLLLTAILHVMYAAWLHNRYGYTFGKWLVGIKVLDITETRPLNIAEAVKRESVYFLLELAVICVFCNIMFEYGNKASLYVKYRHAMRNTGLLWIFITVAFMLSNSKRRTIPDFFAKSVVIRS